MSAKDYFSGHSKVYATFRPTYPAELYEYLFQFVNETEAAWDCGTGNGQVAQELAKRFTKVCATDLSENQIAQAVKLPNIEYKQSPAEHTTFADHQFDLVTVGQALHWFNLDEFYKEVKRTTKPGGIIAVWGYALLNVDIEIDKKFLHFYNNIVGPYWDEARRMVEQEYHNVSFPFEELPARKFQITVNWSLAQFAGYLESWSATQKFIKTKGFDPVPAFISDLRVLWSDHEIKSVTFPVFMKLGRV
jgi:ubiquinone/menaquinone biosynthesis C-methylase UbiE